MLNRIMFILSILTLVSCQNSTVNSNSYSSFQSDISFSNNYSEVYDGYVIPYNNTFSRIIALIDDVNDFVQTSSDRIYFITLDDSKIENLVDITYKINGYYHTERKEKFALQKIETEITLSINDSRENIKIVSNGCKNSEQIEIQEKTNGYNIKVTDLIVGEITTNLSLEYIQNLFEGSIVYLSV